MFKPPMETQRAYHLVALVHTQHPLGAASSFDLFAVVLFLSQVMVTNVTSLLKTVKAVEDEATRGTRALEATIECIKQELAVRTDGFWTED